MPTHPVIDPVARHVPLDAASLALFGLVFAVVALGTLRRPANAVVALVACGPFDFTRYAGATTITLAKMALLGAAVGLIAGRRDLRAVLRPGPRPLLLAGAAVLAATALSGIHARYPDAVVRESLKAAEYLFAFAVVTIAATSDRNDALVARTLALVTLAVAALALAQEWTGAPSGLWFAGFPIPRIAGPLEGPNQLAGYLGIALAMIAASAARMPRARLEWAALAAGSAALALTISRAGEIAALLAIGVALAVSPRGNRRAPALAVAAGSLAGFAAVALWGFAVTHSLAGLDLLERFSTLAEAQSPGHVGTRSQLWHAALVLWRTHPLLGVGAGNFERELGLAGYPGLRTHANSLYLQALAEGGVVLFAATLALVGISIARFARGPFAEPLVAGAFAAAVGFALHQVFDLLVFFPKVGELWWIVLGLAAARLDAPRRSNF